MKKTKDMPLRVRLVQVACCLGVTLLAGCGSAPVPDFPFPEEGEGMLELQAAIAGECLSRGPLTATAFPTSAAPGTVSSIGLCLMNGSTGTTALQPGTDNLKAELTGVTGRTPVYSWKYYFRENPAVQTLHFMVGTAMKVWAYHPRMEGAYTMQVPFDLTTAAQKADQTDLLVATEQTVTVSGTGTTPVALTFKHAFACVEVQMKQTTTYPVVTLTELSVVPAQVDREWIINKGQLNLRNGAITATTKGEVSCTQALTLNGSYQSAFLLLPPLDKSVGSYQDNDIALRLTLNEGGVFRYVTLPLTSSQLGAGTAGAAGFPAGYKYVYQLSYDAGTSARITVDGWAEQSITDNTIGS